MRKMKKFLAVALSAAMVLSVSVPAMAANASNTQTALDQAALDEAEKTEAEKKTAYEDAEVKLQEEMKTLAQLQSKAVPFYQYINTDKYVTEIRKAEDNAKVTAKDINGIKADIRTWEANQKAADAEATRALADKTAKEDYYKNVKALVFSVDASGKKTTYEDIYKKYDATTVSTASEAEQVAWNEVNAAKTNAETAANYYNNTAKPNADNAANAVAALNKQLEDVVDDTTTALAVADAMQALYDAAGDYDKAISEQKAKVVAAEAARDEAKKAYNDAKEATRKAQAKLDTNGQKIAAAQYEKAEIALAQAKKDKESALSALTDAKADLTEIQNRIKQYQEDIKTYVKATSDLSDAEQAVKDTAAALVLAQAQLDIADYGLEVAESQSENVPKIIEWFERDLNNALTDPNYEVSPTIAQYVASRNRVETARAALQTMKTQYPEDVTAVLGNAEAMYTKAYNEAERAREAYEDAKDKLAHALLNKNAGFDKYQTAIKALYVTHQIKDANGIPATYLNEKGQIKAIVKVESIIDQGRVEIVPVLVGDAVKWVQLVDTQVTSYVEVENPDQDGDGNIDAGVVKVIGANGAVMYIKEETTTVPQPLKVNNQVKYFTPENLDVDGEATYDTTVTGIDAYADTEGVERIGHGEYVYVNALRQTITNREEPDQPIPVILRDNTYYDYGVADSTGAYPNGGLAGEYMLEVPQINAAGKYAPIFRYVSDTIKIFVKTRIAVAPYAQEKVAQAKVNLITDKYDANVEAEKKATQDLADAEAEYVYYFGHKPGEQNQATKNIVAGFTDVTDADWFAEYVADVVDKVLMQGYAGNTKFGPYDNLQRQDFVMILWRMAGKPVVNAAVSFKDFDPNAYYADAIRWAVSKGIVKGYNKDEFGIGKNITREDFTVMLHRYYGYPQTATSIEGFADASSVSNYAEIAVKWAVGAGAITGKNNGTTIDPQAPIARCESAKILSIITG